MEIILRKYYLEEELGQVVFPNTTWAARGLLPPELPRARQAGGAESPSGDHPHCAEWVDYSQEIRRGIPDARRNATQCLTKLRDGTF